MLIETSKLSPSYNNIFSFITIFNLGLLSYLRLTTIGMNNVNHGLQFSNLLSFSSINFLSNNDLNPYKLLSTNY